MNAAPIRKTAGGWKLVHAHRSLVKGEREGGGI